MTKVVTVIITVSTDPTNNVWKELSLPRHDDSSRLSPVDVHISGLITGDALFEDFLHLI